MERHRPKVPVNETSGCKGREARSILIISRWRFGGAGGGMTHRVFLPVTLKFWCKKTAQRKSPSRLTVVWNGSLEKRDRQEIEMQVYRLGKRLQKQQRETLPGERRDTQKTKKPANRWNNELWIAFTGISLQCWNAWGCSDQPMKLLGEAHSAQILQSFC